MFTKMQLYDHYYEKQFEIRYNKKYMLYKIINQNICELNKYEINRHINTQIIILLTTRRIYCITN